MRIIPAIDIINGKCVRLTKGDYSTQKIYNEDPLEVALQFEAHGIHYAHVVDLDGAKSHHIVNYKILERIATRTNLKIDFGGGIKSDEDIKIAFECGASQVTGGSIAIKNPELFNTWIQQYGSSNIILGADVNDQRIAINGWKETSEESLIPFIKRYVDEGIKYVICTDISKDGMLKGPSFKLYQSVLNKIENLHLIASGGISSMEDIAELAVIGCEGAIIGKAIYENKISLKELEKYITTQSNHAS
ncbi:1-(5-phosphoribosyl)-5-[(5-phosphoribosylamino)methylideneamino]imidazole-4-carboxamide isomerase [Leptobacterium sp. I13]|uniref:1-(5-phosphoribosyl)-5-[(5- phosphoribosylamino)methylideneamino]imidazole-4- carboxamide isomerase n=1 Tax=Leptobacterium meishanense TaxID=3128904 RepID=UPI0030EDF891